MAVHWNLKNNLNEKVGGEGWYNSNNFIVTFSRRMKKRGRCTRWLDRTNSGHQREIARIKCPIKASIKEATWTARWPARTMYHVAHREAPAAPWRAVTRREAPWRAVTRRDGLIASRQRSDIARINVNKAALISRNYFLFTSFKLCCQILENWKCENLDR